MAVEPVVAPPPGNPRFPLVDALRGMACLGVIIAHTTHVNSAYKHFWLGGFTERLMWLVTLFFVISAFLLYRPFVAARINRTKTAPAIRDYARRRVLRVVPGYWVALTVLWIVFGLDGMSHWWTYYSLTQVYNGPLWLLGGDPPSWTLACEVIFYLLIPVFVWLMRRPRFRGTRDQRFRAEMALVIFLAVVGVLFRLVAAEPAQGLLNRTFLATVDWFAVGMGLAVVSAYLEGRKRQPRAVRLIERHPGWCWVAAIAGFVLISRFKTPTPITILETRTSAIEDLTTHVLYGLVALLLMLPAIFGHRRPGGVPRRIMRNRVLAWLGIVAYGIYLYHWPIMQALYHGVRSPTGGQHWVWITGGTVLFSIAAGAASYYVVERPFLRFKNVRLFGRARRVEPERVGSA